MEATHSDYDILGIDLLVAASAIIEPAWTQDWGSWGSWSKCPPAHFVEAVRVKVESYQGAFYDDSALNGIRLLCSNGQELSSREGPDGQWSSWTSSSHGLTAADMRSEPRDSWAAAAIKFRVRTAEFYLYCCSLVQIIQILSSHWSRSTQIQI